MMMSGSQMRTFSYNFTRKALMMNLQEKILELKLRSLTMTNQV